MTSSSTSGDALLTAEGEYGHLDSPVDIYPWNMTIDMSVKCLFSSNFVLTNLHVFCVNFYYVQYIIIFLCSVYWYIYFFQYFFAAAGYSENHFLLLECLSSCPWLWSKGESSCNFLYLKSLS